MEIRNKLTVTRGEGDNRGKKGKGKSRDMYKGPMDMDNWVGIDCGSGRWVGQGRATGKKLGQLILSPEIRFA